MDRKERLLYNGVSIILPALNEEMNIRPAVTAALEYLGTLPIEGEVIVVNDGSSDATARVVGDLAATDRRVSLIQHQENKGYGASLRDGVAVARYDLVFFTDADRQFDIRGLDVMLPLMGTGVIDVIVGYRMQRKDSFSRKFLSWGFNTLAGMLFDLQIKDIDCAFKLFKREAFAGLKVTSDKFFINTEMLAKARRQGLVILEVGVRHFPRTAGTSTVSLKYVPLTLKELWRIWWQLREMGRSS